MYRIYSTTILFCISIVTFGQNSNRLFENIIEKDNAIEVKVSDGKYIIQFYSSEIIETTFVPNGEVFEDESHAVILEPEGASVNFINAQNSIQYTTQDISVEIQKEPFQISYSYKGNPIISEKDGYVKNDSLETIQFNLKENEILYGGGARALGMNRRGNRLQLYNKAHYGYAERSKLLNYTIPVAISSNQYMIHFDNAPIGYLDFDSKQDNTLTYETISGRKTYQVIVGGSWLDILDNYTDLTGKQPMPPRWALGNFSSRFGYHSQAETEKTIAKFKEDSIPVDAVILDLYWFGKEIQGTLGNLGVYKDSFPDFKGMVSKFNTQNIKTVAITEPFILTTSKRWQEAVDADILAKDSLGNPFIYDFYFGNTGLIDIYKPKAEQWFWNIYKEIADLGVQGVWGDLGEPEVHPSGLLHVNGTADEVHNIYGHDWARLVFEGYQRDFPNQRPFILMRAGYSGSQRYGLIPWSGDVSRSWGGLQSQPEIALQMGMQGLGYMHSDLGGFAGANLDDELYVRWLQYGVFQPIFRPHADEVVPSEPVYRSDYAKAIAKQAIELRYKLLPYNYNLMFENNQTGAPLMRPLFFDEPNRKILQDDATAYLWGKDFLVSPITISKVEEKIIYFPKTSDWFDFYNDELFQGGELTIYKLNENYIPTFIRAGAFIPMAKPMQSTSDYNANNIDLHYYFDNSLQESNSQLYNDDGLTSNAFEKGEYELLMFESELEGNALSIEFEAEIGKNYTAKKKQIQLVIHNIQEEPKYVKIDKKVVAINWDRTLKTLNVPLVWDTIKETEIKIGLKLN